jgi:NAD(P)H-dependent FMN reductase
LINTYSWKIELVAIAVEQLLEYAVYVYLGIPMQILGVSGSLRTTSTNTRLLIAATHFVPPGVEMHLTSYVARLPLFNPDINPEESDIVNQWIHEMRSADGIIVSTPEYARGYPGALKNAFDWLVNTDAYINKPFMLLNASSRSTIAQETFTTVLETMSGVHIKAASVTIPLLGKKLDVSEIVENREFAARIQESMRTFVSELKRRAIDTVT